MSHAPQPRPQSTPFGPLQRRLLGLAGFLAVLMIGLIVFHALHTGQAGLNAVAEAAERTARQPGAKLAIEVRYGAESSTRSIVGTGSGLYDARTGLSSSDLTVPIPGHGAVQMESVGDERRVFLRSPMFAGELPPGKEWLGEEPLLGHSAQTALGSNGSAQSQLEVLKAVGGDVEKLDQQTVRGHLTTRYKGSVELSRAVEIFEENGERSLAEEYGKLAEKIPAPVPVEVWIDEHGLARQFRIVQPLPTTDGPSLTMDMRIQFYAFGPQPKIKLPPKRKVFDFTPVLRAELGMEDGSTLGSLEPPPGASPLPIATFHKRVRRICRAAVGEIKPVFSRDPGVYDELRSLRADPSRQADARSVLTTYATHVLEPANGLLRRYVHDLAAVPPPASLATDYRRLLQMNAKQVEWLLVKARLFELGKTTAPGLAARESENKAEERERKSLAAKLGVPGCESSNSGSGSRT